MFVDNLITLTGAVYTQNSTQDCSCALCSEEMHHPILELALTLFLETTSLDPMLYANLTRNFILLKNSCSPVYTCI